MRLQLTDEDYISYCIKLAKKGEKYVAPNPMVGCVIVKDNQIVAEGYHHQYGMPHAEVNAVNALPAEISMEDCDVYVSLEPCSHYGKTPPCADLLVAHKPNRVIIGSLDPNRQVSGNGVKKLIEAGIDVRIGVLEEECKELNKKFWKAHRQGLPYVTLKWAETQDGFMGRSQGDKRSPKISSETNNSFVHELRVRHQAILVGANTVNRDKPKLDVRFAEGNNPVKVILSPSLSIDSTLPTLHSGTNLIYTMSEFFIDTEYSKHINLKEWTLRAILKDLHQRNIHSVLVEGGAQVLRSFLDTELWDEAIVLKSNKIWEAGINAPWVGIPSIDEVQSGDDLIKYFNRSNK